MTEIPVMLRGGEIVSARVDARDAPLVAQFKWYAVPGAPPRASYRGQRKSTTMSRLVLGLEPEDGYFVFFVDGNRLNCQRANLRIGTRLQVWQANAWRKESFAVHRRGRRWRAQAIAEGKQRHVGYFNSKEEAQRAAVAWRKQRAPFRQKEPS